MRTEDSPNGSAMASILAAGIGAMGMGLIVILNEAGVIAAPALYGPAGGVTGRTTFATVAWLIAWGALHVRWKNSEVAPRMVYTTSLVLIVLGILGTLPPIWGLL